MDRLLQLEVFSKVAELNSLSRAADALGMSIPAASRHLNALEDRLAARLIERNRRRLWLTEAGQEFLQRCTTVLNELAEAEDAASERTLSPKGLLRITSSLSFATIYLAPMLPAFHARYSKLSVQITAANRYPDFIEAGIDVAIRTREQEPDSNIVVRRIGKMRRVLAAAPSYFERRSKPATPADLVQHDMLVYNLANDPFSLRMRKDSVLQTVRLNSVLDSNDGQVVRQAAPSGPGYSHPTPIYRAKRHPCGKVCSSSYGLATSPADDEHRLPKQSSAPGKNTGIFGRPNRPHPSELRREPQG